MEQSQAQNGQTQDGPSLRTGQKPSPQYYAIRLSVEGDLRFLSHHDMMRAVERTAARATVPLRYSQGFNPHPVMSLACPRPVGMASLDDLLVVALENDNTLSEQELPERLNGSAPLGLKFLAARRLEKKTSLHPRRIWCRLPLEQSQAPAVSRRLEELRAQAQWLVKRQSKSGAIVDLDLRPMVAEIEVCSAAVRPSEACSPAVRRSSEDERRPYGRTTSEEGPDGPATSVLCWTQIPAGEVWARPGELLGLLGLDPRVDLARAVRAKVEYD